MKKPHRFSGKNQYLDLTIKPMSGVSLPNIGIFSNLSDSVYRVKVWKEPAQSTKDDCSNSIQNQEK